MKKTLAAAILASLTLAVAAPAFANPFVDVPAKHWAYDSVSKLAAAGIVDGYGDGTFKGDKTITRYEMAQIVAKALTKYDTAKPADKTTMDKLSKEFGGELKNLGVRVAALEAKTGTIAVSGDARLRYTRSENAAVGGEFKERFRLNLKANVNADTTFNGRFMVMQHTEFGTSANDVDRIADASFTTKKFMGKNASVTAGRFSENALSTGYFLGTTGMVDGAKIAFGNEVKLAVGYADMGNIGLADVAYVKADYAASKTTKLSALYLDGKLPGDNYEVWGVGVDTKVAKNVGLKADYNVVTVDGSEDPEGYVVQLSYKGANKAKPQTFGLGLEYKNFEAGSVFNFGDFNSYSMTSTVDVKNYVLSANYTLQKNIVLSAYQTINSESASTGAEKAEFTRVQIDYMF